MSDLRAQVVEAIAAAMSPFGGKSFNMLTNPAQEQLRRQAEAALDAALDVLGENIEAWIRAGQIGHGAWGLASPQIAEGLLAVLRAGKGSDAS